MIAAALAVDADDDRSVYDAFRRARARYGDQPFIHVPAQCAGGQVDLTYGEADALVERLIAGYRHAGYGEGHHIAIALESRADFYLHWLAVNALGATLVPLGADLAHEEIIYILRHADVDLVVHLPERAAAVERAAAAIEGMPYATPAAIDALQAPIAPARHSRADDLAGQAAIVFTSGSTGHPKGCVLSNEYFLTFGRWYRDLGGRCALRPALERLITPLPLNHVNALAFSSMGMILTSGCIVQIDRFRSSTWWSTVKASGATVMHYLGVMPAMLLKLPPHPDERTHALRFGFGGGVQSAHHRAFEDRCGVPLIEAWAMTETGGAGTLSTHEGPRHIGSGCIGRPSPRYGEARIGDEQGMSQQDGELLVRATGDNPRRGFFSGYYKDPEATEAAWRGGWLHTGDIARRDDEGSFFFVGRRKQIIRRSGENISAAEVEAVLGTDERVKEVAVVPVPDEIREEEVFACIVAEPGVELSAALVDSLITAASNRLGYFKLPGYIAFVDSLPVTATQKRRYDAVAELARSFLINSNQRLFDVRHTKRNHRAAH